MSHAKTLSGQPTYCVLTAAPISHTGTTFGIRSCISTCSLVAMTTTANVPHAVTVARRHHSFPWKHPNEVVLNEQDHVHHAVCSCTAKLEDGTREKDKYGFPVIQTIKCCMLGDKHADATHAKGCLYNADHSVVAHLRKWYDHILKTNCGKLYQDRWFPAGKRVWLQVHPRGPLVRLLVSACHYTCFDCFVTDLLFL